MKFMDIIINVAFALAITLGVYYLFMRWVAPSQAPTQEVGQTYTIDPHNDPELLNFKSQDYEIDFIDQKPADFVAQQTVVTTSRGEITFSNEGAAIEHMTFGRRNGAKKNEFDTFKAQSREDKLFLLAFDEMTPYFYRLIDQKEFEDRTELKYQADFASGVVTKQFSIFKKTCKISVQIGLEYAKPDAKKVRTRLIMQAPMLHDLVDDQPNAFFEDKGSLRIYSNFNEIINKIRSGPISLFGLEDKYFTYSMVSDTEKFVQRGFFKDMGLGVLRAYLQSKWIVASGVWTMSFYCGPKQATAFAEVDHRLDKILNFGFLAPISRLLYLLLIWIFNFVHNFGFAIILITILLKLLLLPFTWKADIMMAGLNSGQNDLNKKLAYINEKYKNDPQALARERAEAVRKHSGSAMSGCLPMIAQFLVFIALNPILRGAFDLYRAPFLWIADLSAKDPYYILPVLCGVAMIASSPSTSKDPKMWLMPYAIALFMSTMMMQFASGLVLFVVTTSVTSMVQTYVVKYVRNARRA